MVNFASDYPQEKMVLAVEPSVVFIFYFLFFYFFLFCLANLLA